MLQRKAVNIAKNAFWLFLISTLCGLIFFLQGWVMTPEGKPFSWSAQFYWAMSGYYMWALLFPAIYAFTKKFPVDRGAWKRNIPIHFVAALIVSFLHAWIQVKVNHWMPFVDQSQKSPTYNGYFVGMVMWRMVIFASLVSVAFAVEYYRKFREGTLQATAVEARILRAEMEALKMQLDPDFLFETLHSIKDLMYRDTAGADKMIARLGDFLRLTLDTSGSSQVALRKELEFLKCYLEIQKLRLNNTLSLEFDISPETLDAGVPNLLLYWLVECSIERRHSPEQLKAPLRIQTFRSENGLRMEVTDFLPAEASAAKPLPDNLRERMQQMYGTAFRISTESHPEFKKTIVEIPWIDSAPTRLPELEELQANPEEERGVELEWARRSDLLESQQKPAGRLRPFLWSTFAFTILGLFFTTREILTMVLNKEPIKWMDQVHWFAVWYLWAVAGVYIASFTRRFPLGKPLVLRNTGLHLLNSFVVWALMSFISISYGWTLDPKAGAYWPHLYKEFKIVGFAVDSVLYWMVVAVCSAAAYYREFRRGEFKYARLRAQLARAQLQALKMQLHPHFLFNTLNSISELIQEELATAEAMMAHLERFLRLTLKNSETQEVPFETELEFLKCYLEIEHVRFQDRLSVCMDIEPQAMNVRVPNLLLQPIVENAIRHGIAPRSSTGRIDIRAFRKNGRLQVSIQDDGPGLVQDSLNLRKGLGLSNTRERLQQLYGRGYLFELKNAPGGGLIVTVEIPVEAPAS